MKTLLLSYFLLQIGLSLQAQVIPKNAPKELIVVKDYSIWSIKVTRDCYLVLNGNNWGGLKKETYTEIPLQEGANSFLFKKKKEGEFIQKKVVVVKDQTHQTLDITLVGEVTIQQAAPSLKAPANTRRKMVSKCTDYEDILRSKPKDRATVSICVNPAGQVEQVDFIESDSGTLDQATIDLVLNCARQYRYTPVSNVSTACGRVILTIGIH